MYRYVVMFFVSFLEKLAKECRWSEDEFVQALKYWCQNTIDWLQPMERKSYIRGHWVSKWHAELSLISVYGYVCNCQRKSKFSMLISWWVSTRHKDSVSLWLKPRPSISSTLSAGPIGHSRSRWPMRSPPHNTRRGTVCSSSSDSADFRTWIRTSWRTLPASVGSDLHSG